MLAQPKGHQRVFTDEARGQPFLISLSEGNLLSLLTYFSSNFCQCNCSGSLPGSHKTMPSGTNFRLRICDVRFMKRLCTVFICKNAEDLSGHHTLQLYERTGATRDETKNSKDVCHSDPTPSSGTTLQKEHACLQLQASRLIILLL